MLPGSLVLELAGQFTPRGVGNGLGQLVIFEHAAHIEALHADDIVVPDQLCGELMQVVLPAVGDVLMLPGQTEAGLLPVAAALWFSGQPPLEGGELLLCLLQVLGVIVLLTIRGDDQILDAHIQANCGASAEQLGDIYLCAAQAHEKLTAAAHTDGGVEDPSLHLSGDLGLHPPQLGQLNCLIGCLNVFPHDLAGVAGLAVVFGLKHGEAHLSPALAAGKEVLIGLVHIEHGGLKGGGVHLSKPWVGILQPGQQLHTVVAADRAAGSVGALSSRQSLVVDEPAAANRLANEFFLFCCGVQSELVGFLHGGHLLPCADRWIFG